MILTSRKTFLTLSNRMISYLECVRCRSTIKITTRPEKCAIILRLQVSDYTLPAGISQLCVWHLFLLCFQRSNNPSTSSAVFICWHLFCPPISLSGPCVYLQTHLQIYLSGLSNSSHLKNAFSSHEERVLRPPFICRRTCFFAS